MKPAAACPGNLFELNDAPADQPYQRFTHGFEGPVSRLVIEEPLRLDGTSYVVPDGPGLGIGVRMP